MDSERKYIIALCDGTGKNGTEDSHSTNVYKLYKKIWAAKIEGSTSVNGVEYNMVPLYFPGIGCGSTAAPGLLSKIFGAGIVKIVVRVYMSIIKHYKEGDQVCIFGYSRGAFIARKVASLLYYLGRSVENECQLLEQWKYRENGIPWALKVANQPIPVKYLGVWDTVGGIYSLPRLRQVKDLMSVSDEELPPGVEHALHAVAFHENRRLFRVTLFNNKIKGNIHEVWFAGAHSDVGGGDKETQLSTISLNWMIGQVDAFSNLSTNTVDYHFIDKLAPRDAFRESVAAKRAVDHEETRIESGSLQRTSKIHQTVKQLQNVLPATTPLATLDKLRMIGWSENNLVAPPPSKTEASIRDSLMLLPMNDPARVEWRTILDSPPTRHQPIHKATSAREKQLRSWTLVFTSQSPIAVAAQ